MDIINRTRGQLSIHTLFRLAVTLTVVCISLSGITGGQPTAGAQGQRQVDLELSITNRHPELVFDGSFVVSVLNRSDVTVRDIRVQLEVEDVALGRDIFLQETTHHSLPDNDGTVNYDTLEWTIPYLGGEGEATTILDIDNARTSPGVGATEEPLVRLQGRIVESLPPESPGSLSNNQARDFLLYDGASFHSTILWQDSLVYGVDADPATDTFAVKVSNRNLSIGSWQSISPFQYQVRLRVTPSRGLRYTATPPAGTTFDAATGIWDIGTVPRLTDTAPEGRRQLDIRVTGRDARPGPAEEQCLTVEIEHKIPDPPAPWLPVTACMAHKALILGDSHLFTMYDCVADSDYPCGSQPSLELTATKRGFVDVDGRVGVYTVGDVHRARFRTDHLSTIANNMILQPEQAVLQISDVRGRGRQTDGTWRSPLTYMAPPGTPAEGWKPLTFEVSDVSPKERPGSMQFLIVRTGSDLVLTDPDSKPTFTSNNGLSNPSYAAYQQFDTLGTYRVQYTFGGTKSGTAYTDSGIYTFHVGPVAELEASSARQTPDGGVAISAVNNGPDHSQGVRAVLAAGQSCEFGGVFQDRDWLMRAGQPATRTCVIPNVELTEAQLAGTEPIGHIENQVDYTVCIDSNGRDVLPKPDGDSACQSEGGTWHVGNVYDYIDSNNDIFLSQDPVPALNLQRAQAREVPILVVRWTRLEELFGSPVSYYQVERLDDAKWEHQANVPQPESGDPEYQDPDEERARSPRYRVRAVNEEGEAGPWAEAGGVAQPGVVLALDHTTIKEPDVDSPGALTTATVTATLTGAVSSQNVTIVVSAEPAEEEGVAFTFGENRTLTIPAGQRESTGEVTITALEDADSIHEKIRVTAVAAHAAGNITPVTLTIQDANAPNLELSTDSVTVVEGARNPTVTYMLSLSAEPTDSVVVDISSSNAEVTVHPSSLQFDRNGNSWETPQSVTVSASQDDDAVDDVVTLTHRVNRGRSAPEYHSAAHRTVEVTVTDDDMAGATVAPDMLSITEGLGGKTYTVRLATEPAGSVYVTAASDNPDVRVSPASFTLTSSNWQQGRTVTVSAGHDDDGELGMAMITHAIDADRTSADEYDQVSVGSVSVRVEDDDAPGVRVSPQRLRIAEGRSGSYDVSLNTEPTGEVTVTVSSTNEDVTVEPATLTFTAEDWNRTQRVTVNAGRDDDGAEDEAELRHAMTSGDPAYNNKSGGRVTVSVSDPDRPGVTVGPLSPSPVYESGRLVEVTGCADENVMECEGDDRVSKGRDPISEEHPSFYTVRLHTQPSGKVMIDLEVSGDNEGIAVHPTTLTFTPSEWVRTVRVTAADDDDKDDEKATIKHSIDGLSSTADEYARVSIRDLDVTVADNDDHGVTLLVSGPLEVWEGVDGSKTATYQVVLDSQPDGVVAVGIESSQPDKVSVAVPDVGWAEGHVIFSGTRVEHGRTWPDWDKPQTITVTALGDGDLDDETVTLTHTISLVNAADWDLPEGARVGTVTVTVRDDAQQRTGDSLALRDLWRRPGRSARRRWRIGYNGLQP